MAAQTVIDLELSPSLTNLLEDDILMEVKRLDNGSVRELLSPSPSIPDSDRESNDNRSNRDSYNSRMTTMNSDHIRCNNVNSYENVHQSNDTSHNNSRRRENPQRLRERQGHSFVMISHARANRSKRDYRRPNIHQRDRLLEPEGNGGGGGRDLVDRAGRHVGSFSRNQWPDFGPEIPGSGPIGSISGFPSLVEGPGTVPWMDPFGFEAMNLYAVIQQATEENQALKARVAELEQHLQRTRRVTELHKDKFRKLRDEADRTLREWSRELSRTRLEHEWSD